MNNSRRAVARWAWRLFRRDWRQQALTIVLLIVAVGAAVTGAAMAVNSQFDSDGFFGDGDTVIRVDAVDPAIAQAAIVQATEAFGAVDPIWRGAFVVPGSSELLDMRGQTPDGPLAGSKLALLHGRYPEAAGEAALTDRALEALDVEIGDTIDVEGTSLAVVGEVEDPTSLDDEFVLTLPGSTVGADFVNIVVDAGPEGSALLPADGLPGQVAFMSIHDEMPQDTAIIVVLAITVVLSLVGLVAAAGFVVVAQRRQRQLGLLAAIGGSPKDLRRVMVANGVAVGVIAAAVGTVAGVGGWLLVRPATERAAGRRLETFELPWSIVVVTAVLAVAIASAAAWWPARHMARLPIMGALSGRPADPRPVHRSVLLAVGLLVLGVVLVTLAEPESENSKPVLLSLGLIAVILGVVFVAPAAIRLLAVVARRLPFAPRLALRDLSRYQSRAAASLAAITLGLGIAVSIVAVAAANVRPESEGNLASNHLLVELGDIRTAGDPDRTAAAQDEFDGQAAAVVETLGPTASSVPLDLVFNPVSDGATREPISIGETIDDHTVHMIGWAYVATPEVLDHFGIDPSSIDAATDLLLADDRPVELVDMSRRPDPDEPPLVTQVVDLPAYSSAPFALLTESAMERHGWVASRSAWFVELPGKLSGDQIDAARDAAADVGLRVVARDGQDTISDISRWTTIGGVGLALAIVAMAVGLIRGEAAGEVRTLTATGATARTRRVLTASTATALATLGAVLGIGGAYVFLIAVYRDDLSALTPLPLGPLLTLVIGLPVVATAAGWLLAGREPKTFSRQALE